jgi:zinc protease
LVVILPLVAWSGGACVPPAEQPAVSEVERPRRTKATGARAPALLHPRLQGIVLPSGLRLLLDEDPHATAAGVVSIVAGGSSADPPGAEGLAHLVEHLTYRAVDAAPGGQPVTRWDRLARHASAEMNGFTTRDCLIFYEFGPAQHLDALVDLEAARLTQPLIGVDAEAFAVERQVVGSEHLLREDPRAGGWAANLLIPQLFPPRHPYARTPGGTEESRRKLTLEQARAYASQAFRPERTTLLVSAPASTTSLSMLAERLPPALRGDAARAVARPGPAAAAPKAPPAEAAPAKAAPVERRTSPLPTPELWIGWRLPGALGELSAVEEILESWLQQDVGAEAVLEEEPKIRHVRVSLQPGNSDSVLLVRVLLAEGADPDRAAQVVVARVASAWSREEASEDTFADLKRLYETHQLFDEPSQTGRALSQAMFAAMNDRTAAMDGLWAARQKVPSAAVAKLAYQHLTREKARAIMLTPASAPGAAANQAPPPAPGSAGAAAPRELVPGAATWDPKELDGLQPSVPVTTKTLENGLTVVTVRRRGPAAMAWLAFRGGYASADTPLLVELAERVRPDARQAIRLHILPARGATRDLSFDAVQFQPAQLAESLTLLFAKATVTVKDWPSAEGMARLLAPLAADEDAVTARTNAAFWQALFGDHPYARVVNTKDLGKLTRSDVDAWLGRVNTSRNAALVVVGDVEASEVERAATILSKQIKAPSWIAELAAPPPAATRPASGERVVPVITPRRGAVTDVRLACLLPPMSPADAGHHELLKEAVSARLNAALRSEHGDSYGVSVDVDSLRGGTSYLVATTLVGDENLSRSLGALRNQWQRWARSGFDAAELNVARWRYASTLPFRSARPGALASQLLREWNAGGLAAGSGNRRVFADPATLRGARVSELFATCKANTVLGLTGSEALIQRALEQSWPGLAARAAAR